VDPYQVGLQNDEALDSGAFWFYRKLGFRPLEEAAAHLAAREEERMARTPGYRSSRRTLEKLAHSYMLYECADADHGAWDRFRVRNLGLRCAASSAHEPVLRQIAAVRAKSGDEARYLHALQRQPKLRAAVIELGA